MRSKDTSISRPSNGHSATLTYKVISYVIRFFPARKIMLSGVRRANANDTRSVVWNRVETYTVDTTPRAYTKDHS